MSTDNQRTGILQVVETVDSMVFDVPHDAVDDLPSFPMPGQKDPYQGRLDARRAEIEGVILRGMQRQFSNMLFAALDDGRPYEVTITPFARDEDYRPSDYPFGSIERYGISATIALTDASVAEVGEHTTDAATRELQRDPLRWERRHIGGRFFEKCGRLWKRVT